jgi:hypothetical protein
MCSRLQRLELSSAREHDSRHVDELDIFRDEGTQSLDVMPIPRGVPARLYFPYGVFIVDLGGGEGTYHKHQNKQRQHNPHQILLGSCDQLSSSHPTPPAA